MTEFLAMGGYAAYIWPAYVAAFVILGGLTVSSVLRHRAATRRLDRLDARR